MKNQTVILTGIKGQGASFAADKYLSEGYKVIGTYRRCSMQSFCNIRHNIGNKNFILYEMDICDSSSIINTIQKFNPDIFLNFAAQSHVGSSYDQPIITAEVNYLGVAKILEAIRIIKPDIKFWQASTSERYGNVNNHQDINTKPCPISPYGASKLASEYLVDSYHQTYDIYACYSIMYNYESSRRSKAFLTRKVSDFIGRSINIVREKYPEYTLEECVQEELVEPLYLGNIESKRSWTHCSDTIDAVYQQLQLKKPTNLIIGLEETHSVREFLDEAFKCVNIYDWSKIVKTNSDLIRPSDAMCLYPDISETKKCINWNPKYTFKEIVEEMVLNDIKLNGSKNGV